jgi:aminopeptidase
MKGSNMDERIKKLAKNLVGYSCDVQPKERVLVSYEGEACTDLARQIIKEIYAREGLPYTEIRDSRIQREVLIGAKKEQIDWLSEIKLAEMKGIDAFIAIRGGDNSAELSDVDIKQMNMYFSTMRPVQDYRVNHTKWVVLRYPNSAMAQLANTSLESFTDFYFDVCNLDYGKMDKAMDSLINYMNQTDQVHIVGPGTDLTFSIKDIPAIKCSGERNIPDGEIYTAPVRESMNGCISYNTPSEELGFTYENIRFEIENGKIVKATSNNTEKINELLDTDEGSRYFGEFALGVNPYILHPMKDTLFDEKICGSFHLTPGASYEDAFNGNKSALHWDLVNIQRSDYGGGEIYFDGKLIRKDGVFVVEELEGLNPENLK